MTLPKLHFRDLFWLVLLVAMGCAWWVDRTSLDATAQLILVPIRDIQKWNTTGAEVEDVVDGFRVKVSITKAP